MVINLINHQEIQAKLIWHFYYFEFMFYPMFYINQIILNYH